MLLVTAEGVLVPASPLRVGHPRTTDRGAGLERLLARLPPRPWREQVAADDREPATPEPGETGIGDHRSLPGLPVSVAALRAAEPALGAAPALPLTVRAPAPARALGTVMMAAAMVGAPATVLLGGQDWPGRGLTVVVGGNVLFAGAPRALQHVRLTRERLEVVGALRTHLVPWDRLHGVRREGVTLAVAWEPDVVTDVGPLAPPGSRSERAEQVEQVGAAMLAMRERALAAGAPGREPVSRPGVAWPFLVVYGFASAAAVWFPARG